MFSPQHYMGFKMSTRLKFELESFKQRPELEPTRTGVRPAPIYIESNEV